MARALKVFRTPVGFFDAVVAAPSRKAALEAWGARGDLFALGEAEEVLDPALRDEALARPGEVIRKPRGDHAALLAAAARPAAKAKARPEATARPAKRSTPPDRAALDAAEGATAKAEAELAARLETLTAERDRLDAELRTARVEGQKRLLKLRAARDAAAKAYKAAGG